MPGFLLGLDIGSSSIKASVVDVDSGVAIGGAQSPLEEMPMIALKPGWAEQDPEMWWKHVVISVKSAIQKSGAQANDIEAIGIAYQMHGLVVVDKEKKPLRPSIIWCDSRAVEIGDRANRTLGADYCLQHYLNSPGNFTAAKLGWVKENEPNLFSRIYKFMLPGDYIAMKLTGNISTTDTGLSEGIFWDYHTHTVSEKLLNHFEFDKSIIPEHQRAFAIHGSVSDAAAKELGIKPGVKVSYRAGDQPNNAFSLNVLNPGETAATAGTSGVIYSVTDQNVFDPQSRVNTVIHPSVAAKNPNGVLLCINGTGILNSWLRKNVAAAGAGYSYDEMNAIAAGAPIGSSGLVIFPFGNGAERILNNKTVEASLNGLDFNHHNQSHLFRAAQEGIVFALKFGFDILQDIGLKTTVIRAANSNMFLSPVFREAFVNTIGSPLERYDTDGATGAAIGAGIGAGIYRSAKEGFRGLKRIGSETPNASKVDQYQQAFSNWKDKLNTIL
jgi:xylulokinase